MTKRPKRLEPHPETKKLIVFIHGAFARNPFRFFQEIIREERPELLESNKLHLTEIYYGFWRAIKCWIPGARRETTDYVLSRLSTLRLKYPESELYVVAHSFGTFALGRGLHEYPVGIQKLILFGCVLPLEFNWNTLIANGEVGEIINYRSRKDWVVRFLLSLGILMGFGKAGVWGFAQFGGGRIFNPSHEWGHSGYLRVMETKEFKKKLGVL